MLNLPALGVGDPLCRNVPSRQRLLGHGIDLHVSRTALVCDTVLGGAPQDIIANLHEVTLVHRVLALEVLPLVVRQQV